MYRNIAFTPKILLSNNRVYLRTVSLLLFLRNAIRDAFHQTHIVLPFGDGAFGGL